MNVDAAVLIVSLFLGGIGFVLFVYGKKQGRPPQLVAGLALMVYPHFTPTLASLVGVGALICAAFWYALQLGW